MVDYCKVMIVDDQVFQAEMLQHQLGVFGIEADVALGGEEALELVSKRLKLMRENPGVSNYRLIFMDYSMPDMDGVSTSINIHKLLNEFGIDPFGAKNGVEVCFISAY